MPELKVAGPDHPISIHHCKHRVEALFHGHIIADSAQALVLHEADLPEAYYFPREHVEMEVLLRETDYIEHCRYKGDRSYWRIFRDGKFAEHGAWSYENPYPVAEELRGLITFDPDWVRIHIAERAEAPIFEQKDKIGDYIRHTDSGAGRSQEAPWPPTVGRPDPESGELEEQEVPRPL